MERAKQERDVAKDLARTLLEEQARLKQQLDKQPQTVNADNQVAYLSKKVTKLTKHQTFTKSLITNLPAWIQYHASSMLPISPY